MVTLKRIEQSEWRVFRDMRLQALKENPSVYMSSYDREVDCDESFWVSTLDQKGKCVFGLYDQDILCGFAGVFIWRGDSRGQTGVMAMDYVDSVHRGQGLSRLLYQARIAWALDELSIKKLIISHRDGNEASRRANQAFSFVYTGREVVEWPDGTKAEEWNYSLDLEAMRLKG